MQKQEIQIGSTTKSTTILSSSDKLVNFKDRTPTNYQASNSKLFSDINWVEMKI